MIWTKAEEEEEEVVEGLKEGDFRPWDRDGIRDGVGRGVSKEST